MRAHSVSGMDDKTILRGRPFGGCAVLWKECLKSKITPVTTDCKRLCCITVENEDFKMLICNVYMPTYSNSNNYISSFNDTLSTISTLLLENHIDHIVIGGDFNVDLMDQNVVISRYVTVIIHINAPGAMHFPKRGAINRDILSLIHGPIKCGR